MSNVKLKVRILYNNSMEEFNVSSYPIFLNYFVSFITEGTYLEPVRTKLIPNKDIVEMEIINDKS